MEPPCSIEQGGFFVLCFDEYKNAITLPKVEAWAMTPEKVKFDVFYVKNDVQRVRNDVRYVKFEVQNPMHDADDVKFDVFWSFYNSLITVKMPNLCL